MRDEFAEYREYIREGLRIEVGIPLAGGGVFRDWAIVQAANQDEIVAQISRDMLPLTVKVSVGTILDVSVWRNKDVYSCSSMVLERVSARRFKIRLFGSFTLRERRQFFRIDLDLRVTYSKIIEANKDDIHADWEKRLELERMKFQGYDNFVIAAHSARLTPVINVEWQDVPWTAVNLGGGGALLRLQERLPADSMVNLEIVLPLEPPRQVHTVATVIHVMEPKSPKDGVEFHRTGFQFVHMDERDRDFIFQHISAKQIEYLAQRASTNVRGEYSIELSPKRLTVRQIVLRSLWTLFLLAACFFLIRYLTTYQKTQPANEIQKTYEKAIREYRKEAP
ncbi:PilZ-like domain-containing protein [Geomesophilobacter sediminis]|uniref:DUF5634 family protein n=1 Tax=Geomesophilobacter sediminis TaxID=2798584 RepID=A0A8J7S955_9BACT|nr:PilZ-like domain-containing protein [Geomesophilobacter sediminis]MBJ6726505.1 DUF5634 family protein [Geomesophilobacter sediminis]